MKINFPGPVIICNNHNKHTLIEPIYSFDKPQYACNGAGEACTDHVP